MPPVLAHGGTAGAIGEIAFVVVPIALFAVLARMSRRRREREEAAEAEAQTEAEPEAEEAP